MLPFRVLVWALASLLVGSLIASQELSNEWIKDVAPLLLAGEESAYRNLSQDEEREQFQREFWASRSVTREEYYRRLAYIDHEFGSGKQGSGWNTDQGRVYLTLGEPHALVRLPESRIFYPMEIWRYRAVPEAGIHAQMDLLFYRRRDAGLPKLYSPTLDTVRALLRPNPATRGMFPANDIVSSNDLLERLNVSPAEVDFAEAAFSITKGIKGLGNDELLAVVTSPARALERGRKTMVQSRFLASMPIQIQWHAFRTSDVGGVVDIAVECSAARTFRLEVLDGPRLIDAWQTNLPLSQTEDLVYLHRAYLLTGRYTVRAYADGAKTATEITIPGPGQEGMVLPAEADLSWNGGASPFAYGNMRLLPSASPRMLVASVPTASGPDIAWRVRQGSRNVASGKIAASRTNPKNPEAADEESHRFVHMELPELDPGDYVAELECGSLRSSAPLRVLPGTASPRSRVVYSANLGPGADRLAWGRQLAVRRDYAIAEASLSVAARNPQLAADALTLMAKLRHIQGDSVAGNELLDRVLRTTPQHFDALATYGFSKANTGDRESALAYFRRAIMLREDATIANAIASLERDGGH